MTRAGRPGTGSAWLWHGLFAVTLAMPTMIAVVDPDLTGRAQGPRRRAGGGPRRCSTGWCWPGTRSGGSAGWRRCAVYWAAVCALVTAAGQAGTTSFTIALYGLYPLMIMTLGWWGMVPVVGLTALMGWALGGWGSGPALVTNLLATAGLAAADRRLRLRRSPGRASSGATRWPSWPPPGPSWPRPPGRPACWPSGNGWPGSCTTPCPGLHQRGDPAGVGRAGARRSRPELVEARERLETARQTARTSLEELRRSVRALRPDLLESGLAAAGADRARPPLVGGLRAYRPSCASPATRSRCIPTPSWRCCGSAQEALTNVAPARAASRVVVSLSYLGGTVTARRRRRRRGLRRPAPTSAGGRRLRPDRDAGAGRGGRRQRWRSSRRPGRAPRSRCRCRHDVRRTPLRIVVVDDHPVVRDGLRGMLDGQPDLDGGRRGRRRPGGRGRGGPGAAGRGADGPADAPAGRGRQPSPGS